jgi:hypothetical protein
MSRTTLTARHTALSATLSAALIAVATLPATAQAAVTSASCTLKADYSLNNSLVEAFAHSFIVNEGTAYEYDFSTTTRQKSMLATIARTGNRSTVTVDYFNDVGTFVAIEVDTSVSMQNVGQIGSTSGSHKFYTSQGVVGTHATVWSLTCKGR